MAANRLELPFGFFPERAFERAGRAGAGRAQARDREVGEVGLEPVVPLDQLVQGWASSSDSGSSLPHRPHVRWTCSASSVLWYSAPGLQVRVREHADLLQQRERPVDGGRVHSRHLALHLSSDRRGGDVALGPHDLGDDGPALGGHPQALAAQQVDDVGVVMGGTIHAIDGSSVLHLQLPLQLPPQAVGVEGGSPSARAAQGRAVRACLRWRGRTWGASGMSGRAACAAK